MRYFIFCILVFVLGLATMFLISDYRNSKKRKVAVETAPKKETVLDSIDDVFEKDHSLKYRKQ